MNEILENIKQDNLNLIDDMKDLLPETKELLKEYVKKFGVLFPKMKMTTYDNPIYIRLIKDALEDDLPIIYEDIEEEFKYIKWDVVH